MTTKKILAIDIGGTKISSGIVSLKKESFKISDYQKIKTPKNKKEFVQKIIELVDYYEKNNGFDKIGIGIAGQVNNKNGVVRCMPNIKSWKNLDLKKIVEKSVKKKISINNDVKCFALAENKFGKSKEHKNAVYLTIGTGIGGAIETGGKLYNGENNIAGEFGHMVIVCDGKKCGCGNRGCWEQYASGSAIEKLYFELYGKKKKTKEIALDSVKGNEKDKRVIKKAASYLAAGFVNIINAINPEIIIVGGSAVKQKEILNLAIKEVRKKVLIPARKTRIVKSNLGDEAVLIGAAMLEDSNNK